MFSKVKIERYPIALSERVIIQNGRASNLHQKGARVFFPKRIHIFDEIEKQNQTQVVFKEVDGQALPKNIFTKAWLESQSR